MENRNTMRENYIDIDETIDIARSICLHLKNNGYQVPLLLMVRELKKARNQKFIKTRRNKYVWAKGIRKTN